MSSGEVERELVQALTNGEWSLAHEIVEKATSKLGGGGGLEICTSPQIVAPPLPPYVRCYNVPPHLAADGTLINTPF